MIAERRHFMCNSCNREFLLELEPAYPFEEDMDEGFKAPDPDLDEIFCPYCQYGSLEVTATPEELEVP
jgi:DNA-directed RNA polymerase subunit RPC12/RpoP